MKSLEEHNRHRSELYKQLNDHSPRPNGIECPTCKSELLDSDPRISLSSNPPQTYIHCPNCDYRGYRVL